MLGILHMTWSEHFYLTGLPWSSFRPFSWWSWCGLLRGFSVSSIEVKKNRRLKLRELSPALIAAFSNMVIFHPVGRSFSGGCMCVRNDSTPPKKTGVNVVPEFWWIQISIAIQIKLLYLGELQVQFCSSLDNTPPPQKKKCPLKRNHFKRTFPLNQKGILLVFTGGKENHD